MITFERLEEREVVGFPGFRGEDLKRGEENYSGGLRPSSELCMKLI